MAPKIKVLHVVDHLGTGGAQEVILNQMLFRDEARFECAVACLYGEGVYYEKFRAMGFEVHSLSPRKYLPLYFLNFWRLLGRERFDIVHFHLNAANILLKPLAAWRGVPARINHDHLHDPNRYKKKILLRLDRATNRYSTHVIAVSQSVADFLADWEGIPRARLTTIHNGIDIERFRPRPEDRAARRRQWHLPEGAVVVAGVGRLRHQKNFFLFLDVAARVMKKCGPGGGGAAHFVIAGDGPDERALKARARELGIEANVTFLGFVRDVTELYPAVDVFLMTSRFEGTPMTILEAMACRLAIVASAVDGIKEVLEHERQALLCDPGGPDDFVRALERLIGDRGEMAALAGRAFDTVTAHHSARAVARRIEAIYDAHFAAPEKNKGKL